MPAITTKEKINKCVWQNVLVYDADAPIGILTSRLLELSRFVKVRFNQEEVVTPKKITKIYITDESQTDLILDYLMINNIKCEIDIQLLNYVFESSGCLQSNDLFVILIDFEDGSMIIGSF